MPSKYWYVEHLFTIYPHYKPLGVDDPVTSLSRTNQTLLGTLQYVPFKGKINANRGEVLIIGGSML